VAIVVGADRLHENAANAFLKTLEEPPAGSVFILLSIEPQRILETILSRCLRLNFTGEPARHLDATFLAWLTQFAKMACAEPKSLLGRYRLLSVLLGKLAELKGRIDEAMTKRSPLERYEEVEPDLKEKWEDELVAAIEAEYRRQRTELLAGLQWWLRDVWLATLRLGREMWSFPQLGEVTGQMAGRVSSQQAMENLQSLEETQQLLTSNVQEALAMEVGLLRLKL
jgi:DNA polymerase-3 subunit delta'